MIGWIILGVIVALITLIMLIPIGADVNYEGGKLTLSAKVCGVLLQLIPKKPVDESKPKKEKKPKKPEKPKKPKKAKKSKMLRLRERKSQKRSLSSASTRMKFWVLSGLLSRALVYSDASSMWTGSCSTMWQAARTPIIPQ